MNENWYHQYQQCIKKFRVGKLHVSNIAFIVGYENTFSNNCMLVVNKYFEYLSIEFSTPLILKCEVVPLDHSDNCCAC